MCISCRDRSAKRTLVRIVRTPEGAVELDPTGRRNGRGAYLCDDPACWERALRSNVLANALKTTIDAVALDTLRRHAATLTPVADAPASSRKDRTNDRTI
jgi:predicted RNA-binding protein YlxR (DUF448 family)